MKQIHVGDIVGDYKVIDVAGSGGMGAVYRIEHRITKRIEAMKLLPPGIESDPDQVRRFEREIQLQARLHHPNIVSVYNAIRHDGMIALVMEFVEGRTLQRVLESGPLPISTAVDYTCQILRALTSAHEAGVVHRDVSPANIIITADGVAKLTDFGLARGPADMRLSTSGAPLGSPWYMSPEQVRGVDEPDARTDFYSMGAVLHEMLTGKKLFDAEGEFAVMRAQVELVPVPPSSRNAAVPPEFDAIVAKALAKDPAHRFASADEFRLAVEQAPRLAPLQAPAPVNALEPTVVLPVPPPVPSPVPPSVRSWNLSRSSIVMLALMPALLIAGGFSAVRLIHRPPPKQIVKSTPAPVPAPAVVQQPAPVAPAVVAPEPAAEPASVVAKQTVPVAPRRVTPKPIVRSVERSTALRITNAEAPEPPMAPQPRRIVESPAEPAPTPAAAAQPVPESAASQTAEPPSAAAPEAAPADLGDSGNRLVRAIGKLNPFRKKPKPDAAGQQLKKDQ